MVFTTANDKLTLIKLALGPSCIRFPAVKKFNKPLCYSISHLKLWKYDSLSMNAENVMMCPVIITVNDHPNTRAGHHLALEARGVGVCSCHYHSEGVRAQATLIPLERIRRHWVANIHMYIHSHIHGL